MKSVATHAPHDGRAVARIHDARRAALEGELADAAHVAVDVVAPGPARDGVDGDVCGICQFPFEGCPPGCLLYTSDAADE